jgi:hypothetical protein
MNEQAAAFSPSRAFFYSPSTRRMSTVRYPISSWWVSVRRRLLSPTANEDRVSPTQFAVDPDLCWSWQMSASGTSQMCQSRR